MKRFVLVLLALFLLASTASAADYYVESDYNTTVPVNVSAGSSSYLLVDLQNGFSPSGAAVYDIWDTTARGEDYLGTTFVNPHNITYEAETRIVGTASTARFGLSNTSSTTDAMYIQENSDGADYLRSYSVVSGSSIYESFPGYSSNIDFDEITITTNATHAEMTYSGYGTEIVTPITDKAVALYFDEVLGTGEIKNQKVRKHYDNAPTIEVSYFGTDVALVEIANPNNFALTEYQVTFDLNFVDQTDESVNITAYNALDVPVPTFPINNENLVYEYPPVTNPVNLTWTGNGGNTYTYEVRDIGGTLVASGSTSNTHAVVEIPEGSYYWSVESDLTETMDTLVAYFTVSSTYITEDTTAVVGVVYEMEGGVKTPIPQAVVYISNDTYSEHETVGSDGYYSFTGLEASSTYYIKASATDYDDSEIALVTPSGGNTTVKDVLLVAETKYYEAHKVEYIICTIWGTVYPDVEVDVFKSGSVNALYSGETGTDGAITFELDEEVQYRLIFVNSTLGIDEEITHYPKEERYNVYVERSLTDLVDTPSNRNQEINITVNGIENGDDTATVSVSYLDAMTETNSVTIYLNQSNRDDPVNQTTIDSVTINSDSDFTHNFTLSDYSGQAFLINLDIDHDTFGEYRDSYSVRFSGMIEDFGWSGIWVWLAIGCLVFVGGMFGQRSVPIGGLTVCIAAWIMFSIGMFDEIVSTGFVAGMILATILAVVSYISSKAREEYT